MMADACYQIRNTLERIELWASVVSPMPNKNRDEVVEMIDAYVSDLDFNMQALNLSISVMNAAREMKPKEERKEMSEKFTNVSVSAFLRSSRRIEANFAQTGDITYSVGSLYWKDEKENEWKLEIAACSLKVHSNPARNLYELQVEALNDPGLSKKSFDLLPGLNIQISSSISLGLKSAIGVLDVAIVWSEKILNSLTRKYAFVFEKLVENGNIRNLNGARPLDVLYICRLCSFDNGNKTLSKAYPPHVLLNDEEIWCILANPIDPHLTNESTSELWADVTLSYENMPAFHMLNSSLASSTSVNINQKSAIVSSNVSVGSKSKEQEPFLNADISSSLHENHFTSELNSNDKS